ncbi:MAG: ROK family protein [Pirellulales bacterium]|nr:ROK family protein [Pirellulales bacterium]
MLLGIEIGGTKIQLGIGAGTGPPLAALERFEVDREAGASGILNEIVPRARELIARHAIDHVGIGFGGPVDPARGRTVKSHHVAGWDDFPLVEWCRDTLGLPAVMANDADAAGLAEAVYGAGREFNPVFYVTVGTGIGGGLIIDRRIYRGAGAGAAELGHLRPGLSAENPEAILESYAAGWGIAAAAQSRLAEPVSHRIGPLRGQPGARRPEDVRQRLIEVEEADEAFAGDLLERCDGRVDRLTARLVGEAAAAGNGLALQVLDRAWQALGWGIAQMITLVAPEAVVIGGGVSLLGEELFFEPIRREVERYVFPPFLGKYHIVPAELGEDMVVHGALALAAQSQH